MWSAGQTITESTLPMYEVITIGSSLVDSFIKSPSFQLVKNESGTLLCQLYGEKIEVDEYSIHSGGGANNTSVGFARMGFRTGIVTEIGKDVLSEILLENLRKEFVSTNLVIREKNEVTGGSIILLGEDGGRTVMVHRGASAMIDPSDIPNDHISRAKWVHLSSISGRYETLAHLFSLLKSSKTKYSWNPGKRELALLRSGQLSVSTLSAEILFVNREEWESIEMLQDEIVANVPNIVVTDGKQGGVVYRKGEIAQPFMAQSVSSVDDTGAGDAFAVGYVSAFLKNLDSDICCKWGIANAASVVQYIGAQQGLLTIDQIKSHNGI